MCEKFVNLGNLVHDIIMEKEDIFFRVETQDFNLSQRGKVSQDYLNFMEL